MPNYLKIVLFLLPLWCFGQNKQLDSLKTALKTVKNDTSKCTILLAIGEIIYSDNADSAKKVWLQASTLIEKNLRTYSSETKNERFIYQRLLKLHASALANIAYIESQQGNITESLKLNGRSLKISEELGDKSTVANTLNNIGFIYHNQGNAAKALENYSKCLRVKEEIADSAGIATSLNNIGLVYSSQNDLDMALQYYKRSLKIRIGIGQKRNIAGSLNNVGLIFRKLGNSDSALAYYERSLKIREEIGDKNGIAISLANIGAVYAHKNETQTALQYYNKSLSIRTAIGDKSGIASSYVNIAWAYIYQKKYDKALEFSLKAKQAANELGLAENIRNSAEQLSKIYRAKGNYMLALENQKLYIKMRDSITNEDTKKASIKSQLNYEYEKKAIADSTKVAEEKKISAIQLQKDENQRYLLYAGILLTLVFGAFMLNRLRVTQKQKSTIDQQKNIAEEQKQILEHKQKEILDSIHYAKRIQTSLLPTEKYLERIFKRLIS